VGGGRSLGGVAHECEACNGTTCAALGQSVFNTTFDASDAGLASGDVVAGMVFSHTRAARSSYFESTTEDAVNSEVIVDLTPPTLSHVADSLPCNVSNATCAEHREKDVDVIAAGTIVQAWWYNAADPHSIPIGGSNGRPAA